MISNIDWDKTIKKEVRGVGGISDDYLGEVQEAQGDNILTKVGVVDKYTYSIPKKLIDKFDGHTLWISITKEEAKRQFEIKE